LTRFASAEEFCSGHPLDQVKGVPMTSPYRRLGFCAKGHRWPSHLPECPACAQQAARVTARRQRGHYGPTRSPSSAVTQTPGFRAMRRAWLRTLPTRVGPDGVHYQCAHCLRITTQIQVDHLRPVSSGYDRYDVAQWLPACATCNNSRKNRAGWRAYREPQDQRWPGTPVCPCCG
jgi:hypothetical protein